MKILITKSVSDWFEDEWIELDTTKFDHYKLRANEMVWQLECFKTKFGESFYIDHFDISPQFDVKILIRELNVTEIKGNNCRTIKDLLK